MVKYKEVTEMQPFQVTRQREVTKQRPESILKFDDTYLMKQAQKIIYAKVTALNYYGESVAS